MSTIDKDLGYRRILREVGEFADTAVEVGYWGDARHDESELTITGIAAVHEFGTEDGKIPERPFMRQTAEEHREEYRAFFREAMKRIIEGKGQAQAMLRVFGEKARGDIVRKITESKAWAVPLAESTIKAKSRGGKLGDQPLVDTGQMRDACAYRVVKT